MKKYFVLIGFCILISCRENHSSEKQIDLVSFEEKLREARESGEYDALVYDRALYMYEDGMAANKTLPQLLEEAKEINRNYNAVWEKFEADKKEFSKIFTVVLADGFLTAYEESDEDNPDFPEYYAYHYRYTTQNNSDKTIVKYEGDIFLMDPDERFYVVKLEIEDEVMLPPGAVRPDQDLMPLGDRDDLEGLQNTPFENLVPVWETRLIVFEDGSSLEAIPPRGNFNEYHRNFKK